MHFESGLSRARTPSAWNVNSTSGSSKPNAKVLGELSERLDVDVASVETGERRYHRVLNSTESHTTAVGTVKVRRTPYRCGHERAVVPMELRVGMVDGHWTPPAARQARCVVAQLTPKEGPAIPTRSLSLPCVESWQHPYRLSSELFTPGSSICYSRTRNGPDKS